MPGLRPAFDAAPSVVGSFPHTDADRLVDRILTRFARFPAWPQLPARDWRESMYVQYSEGLPGAVLDESSPAHLLSQGRRVSSRSSERFYQAVVEEDVERFAISREYALGLHLFLERIRTRRTRVAPMGQGPGDRPVQLRDDGHRRGQALAGLHA